MPTKRLDIVMWYIRKSWINVRPQDLVIRNRIYQPPNFTYHCQLIRDIITWNSKCNIWFNGKPNNYVSIGFAVVSFSRSLMLKSIDLESFKSFHFSMIILSNEPVPVALTQSFILKSVLYTLETGVWPVLHNDIWNFMTPQMWRDFSARKIS